jgi:predicted Zn-dependent peptidase
MLNIEVGKLENGIRIVNDYMPDVETVAIRIIVRTGSRNENIDNNGISHFLEHLAFKGTEKRTAKQIAYDFEGIGASFNAYTSKEATVYYSKNLKEYTEKALEILVDMFENSTFDEEELEKERGVILQELAMVNDSPNDIIFDYYSNTAFKDQAYGRSIIGTAENIKKFTKDDFKKYIQNNYVNDDIVLSVAGNIKFSEITKIANKYFKRSNTDKSKKIFEEAKYTGGFFKKEKDLEQMQYIIGFEGKSYHYENKYKLSVMNHILGSGMSSRLFQEIRENKGLCYTIHSYNSSTFETGSFKIYTAIEPENVNKVTDAIAEECNKMINNVNDEELNRAKIKIKSSMLMNLESSMGRAAPNGFDLLYHEKVIPIEFIVEEINSTTKDDVKNILKELISGKPTVAMYGKIKKDVYDYDKIISKFS